MKAYLSAFVFMSMSCSVWATQRETFDFGWKFAKYGKFADCLSIDEPGKPSSMASATSTQSGHSPYVAIDGDLQTRWCADNGSPASLTVDFGLGRTVTTATTQIVWEQSANYRYTVETSLDGRTWQVVIDRMNKQQPAKVNKEALKATFRYARINVKPPSAGVWASICEWTFSDADGKKVVPELPEIAALKPSDVAFDDHNWRALDVPHDWGVESEFLPDEPNETGKLPWNAIGWYRKTFTVDEADRGKQLYLDFDGVMMTPQVYVNGQLAGEWAYGYNSFRVDITPYVQFGKSNLVAVRAENRPRSTRWYPGAGIYRHVWLTTANPTHIDHWGVFVHTPEIKGIQRVDKGFTAESATITSEVTVTNKSKYSTKLVLRSMIAAYDKPTEVIAKTDFNFSIDPGQTLTLPPQSMTQSDVILWDIENPYRYVLTTELHGGDGILVLKDRKTTPFGIRTAVWKADGFYLNDRRVQIKGVCQHHDMGPLGSAVHTRAIERQVEILKSFGTNAIRTAHNPPAPELLEICDRLGMLVDNELFDIWEAQKYDKSGGYHLYWKEWHAKDVRNFVMRDRNHPSVIAWSAGNEVTEQWQGNGRGAEVAEELHRLFKQYDPSRQTTVGCNFIGSKDTRLGKAFDIYGFNYKPSAFKQFAKDYPTRPFVSAESSSCVSSRGKYYFPPAEHFWKINAGFFAAQVSSYDLYAPGWAYRPDIEFAALEDTPQCAGEFVWTGFDYIGEPTPYNQDNSNIGNIRNLSKAEQEKIMAEMAKLGKAPSRSSYFGIVDLCGFWKDRTYLYQSHWMPDVKMAHILPHWNWQGEREGKVTPVFVYTSGDAAELFLNGQSLGKKVKGKGDKDRFRLCWEDVIYAPGKLEVVAYKNGLEWARDVVETTGPVASFTAKADRTALTADGRDISYITITVVDEQGRMMPTASNRLHFTQTGPFDIVGVCNGDPTDPDSMKGKTIRAFSGMAQVIVRSKRNQPGEGTLTIRMEGVPQTKTVKITSSSCKTK